MNERLAHSTLYSAISSLSVILGGFLSSVLTARLLGVEAAGVVAFATWAISVGVMVGDLGVPGAIARYLPDLRSRGLSDDAKALIRWLARGLLGAAALIFLAFLGCGLVTGYDAQFRGSEGSSNPTFWIIVGGACLLQTIASLCNGYLRGKQDFARLARLTLIAGALQVAATVAGALTFGALGALAGAIAVGLPLLVLLPEILGFAGQPPAELKRRVRRFAWESWASYLVTAFAWARMEIVFLQVSWGSHAVALFAVSLTLANLATQGPLLLTGGLLPHLSQRRAGEEDRGPQEVYATGIRLLAFLLLPACLGAAAIAPSLVPAMYGKEFSGAVPSTMVLLCGSAVAAPSSVAFTYLLAMERTRFVLAIGGAAAAAVTIGGLTLVPVFGVMAAAIARAAIQASAAVATMWYLARYVDCPTPIMSLVRIAVAASASAAIALACVTLVPGPPGIAAAVALGVCTYGVLARLLKILPKRDTERLSSALAVLPGVVRVPAYRTLRLIAP